MSPYRVDNFFAMPIMFVRARSLISHVDANAVLLTTLIVFEKKQRVLFGFVPWTLRFCLAFPSRCAFRSHDWTTEMR